MLPQHTSTARCKSLCAQLYANILKKRYQDQHCLTIVFKDVNWLRKMDLMLIVTNIVSTLIYQGQQQLIHARVAATSLFRKSIAVMSFLQTEQAKMMNFNFKISLVKFTFNI
jgi:hypothetical protein